MLAASCLVSNIQLVQFCVFLVVAPQCLSFALEFLSLFGCSRFPCWFARQLQRWGIFHELMVTLDGLGTVGMFTFGSCASRLVLTLHFYRPGCSGLFCLMSLALFVSPAPPSPAPPCSRMVFAWATVMDSRFFEYVALDSLGLRLSCWILAWFLSRRCCRLLDAPS